MESKNQKDTKLDWTMMPKEVSELFCKGMSIRDQVLFGSVCKNWLSSTSDKAYLWVPDTPWLITNEGTCSEFGLFSYTLKKKFIIPKPFMPMENSFIVASSKGWLIILSEDDITIFMLNPFSNIRIDLPPLSTVFDTPKSEYVDDTPLGFSISTCSKLNPIHVVGVTFRGCLTWCKIGNKEWKGYKGDCEYGNITFYNDKLYAIDRHGTRIDIFKVDDESPVFFPLLNTIQAPTNPPKSNNLDVYLVESNTSLLVVKRYYQKLFVFGSTTSFDVLKVKEDNNSGSPKLINVDSLDDQVLFLSDLNSESLEASNCPGFQKGRIYFVGHSELGAYVVEEKSVIMAIDDSPFHMRFPIWILPRFVFECSCKLHDSTLLKKQKHEMNQNQERKHAVNLPWDEEHLNLLTAI